jgi:hypothetical protein
VATRTRVFAAGSALIGEPAVWPTAAIVASASLYATMPSRFIAGPSAGVFSVGRWVVPGLTVLLFAALLVSVPQGKLVGRLGLEADAVHLTRRVLAIALIAVLSAANAAAIVLLIHGLVNGVSASAPSLLRAAVHMWCVNVLLFGLWFWELDGGGPLERPACAMHARDFLFPQQTEPALLESGWHPTFIDYLFVSFTNAAAFSPTDTLPLSRWAKMLMLVEASISLALAVMVVARAVNILK